jgi:hypothetical protein
VQALAAIFLLAADDFEIGLRIWIGPKKRTGLEAEAGGAIHATHLDASARAITSGNKRNMFRVDRAHRFRV